MSDPKQEFENQFSQNLERNRSMVADFWQGQAAYWQTVADIMGRRAATTAEWWQALPQQWQALAQSGGFPGFMEQLTRWQQQSWLGLWHLNVDTQQQRNHLMEELQKLAGRNGFGAPKREEEKPVVKSSFYAANPHLTPAPKPAAAPAPAPAAPKPQAAPVSTVSNGYTPQPLGTFIPGPEKKIVAPVAASAPVSAAEPNGHDHHAATPEPARNAAQAATLAGATSARRSVVASHRSRASRNRTH